MVVVLQNAKSLIFGRLPQLPFYMWPLQPSQCTTIRAFARRDNSPSLTSSRYFPALPTTLEHIEAPPPEHEQGPPNDFYSSGLTCADAQ